MVFPSMILLIQINHLIRLSQVQEGIFRIMEMTLIKSRMLLSHHPCEVLVPLEIFWKLQMSQLKNLGQKLGCGNEILRS